MGRAESFPLDGPGGAARGRDPRPDGATLVPRGGRHPHPLYGGTMDNAVVMLAARALLAPGGETLRFNFRGVGRAPASTTAARRAARPPGRDRRPERPPAGLPLLLAGYSFGAVMTLDHLVAAAAECGERRRGDPAGVLLIAPPVTHYEGAPGDSARLPPSSLRRARRADAAGAVEERRRAGAPRALPSIPGVGHDLGSFTAPRALMRRSTTRSRAWSRVAASQAGDPSADQDSPYVVN